MATIEQLSAALVKADAAGNTADAKVFADALRTLKAQGQPAPTMTVGSPGGMTQPGNLNLDARTVYHGRNRDQPWTDYRTENSMSLGTDQGEVLIPTVVGGRQLTPEQAIQHYQQTGENLGVFASPDEANAYAETLHNRQADRYGPPIEVTKLQGRVADLPSHRKPPADLMNSTAATVNGLVNGIPVLGPITQNLADAIGGTVAQVSTGDLGPILTPDRHKDSTAYKDYVADQQAKRQDYARAAPLASMSGNLVGSVGSLLLTGGTSAGAQALGITSKLANPAANLGQRVINSGLSTLGLGTADSIVRGKKPTDALMENLTPAGIAAALPLGGAVVRAAGRGVRDNFIRPIATAANRENEVTRRLAGAINQDIASGARMTQGTERVAADAGADVLNADRFGSAIRTLARTASNVSPEADNIFRQATEQRFVTQGNRAVNFVRRLMGGATDDLALQDRLRTAADATNDVAYKAAYSAPKAKAIWTPQIRNLFTADPFKKAVQAADATGANYAAITGRKAVRNPFVFDESGNVAGLRQLPGGGQALPNLEFWDIVQRNLRTQAEQAARQGDNLLAGQIGEMRKQLLSSLDGAVPEFQQARRGAAGFFGAEDAIEAGRKAVTSTKQTPEIERAVAAMTPAEREAFSVGFSSEIIDAISATRDRVNVINSIFGSQSARDRIRIALGPQRARELEAYVKMEQVLDQLRTATQGNSTTAKQLIQAGLMGGGAGGLGYIASGGDLTSGFSAASIAILGRRGLQMIGKHVDDQVMKRVAEVLSSSDPSQLQRAIQNASLSQAHMDAIDAIMRALGSTSRGTLMGGESAAEAQPPVQITVRGGTNSAAMAP